MVRKESGPQMSLTDIEIRNAVRKDKPYKLTDGRGLFLLVQESGGKLWRFKYRVDGLNQAGKPARVEKKLSLGRYPDVTLARARGLCDEARSQLAAGIDPAAQKALDKVLAKASAANTFAEVADEYIRIKMEAEGKAAATIVKARWFLDQLTSTIGKQPIVNIEPHILLSVLKLLEAKGKHETAKKTLSFASRVFRYGVATARCKSDPAALLKGALIAPKVTHHAAILEPEAFGQLLRAIEGYDGSPIIRSALLIAPHVFVRPGELRHADWNEFDFEESVWRIPADKMKLRRPHAVPLSRQVKEHLVDLAQMTGREGYVFSSFRSNTRPMSENTLNAAFRRMGFTRDEVTAHGLRSTASTLLNESGRWNPDAIERALAHGDSNAVRGAYHRGTHWAERVEMAQWWSDYLDRLQRGSL